MPCAQLLPSKKVLWKSDRDIGKWQIKRGRGHEEIAPHACTMNILHEMQSLFFSFSGIRICSGIPSKWNRQNWEFCF